MVSLAAAAAESVALFRAGTRAGAVVRRLVVVDINSKVRCGSVSSHLQREACAACGLPNPSRYTSGLIDSSGRVKCKVNSLLDHTQSAYFGSGGQGSFHLLGGGGQQGRGNRAGTTVAAMVSKSLVMSAENVGLTKPGEAVIPKIHFSVSSTPPNEWAGDILAVAVWEESLVKDESSGLFVDAELEAIDAIVGGLLSELVAEGDFKGKVGQSVFARLGKNSGLGCKRLGLLGLGKKSKDVETDTSPWRSAGSTLASTAKGCSGCSAALLFLRGGESEALTGRGAVTVAKGVASGVVLGSFEDTRFKSEVKKPTLESVELLGLEKDADVDAALSASVKVSAGVILTRKLVNAPANVLTPGAMAEVAIKIAETYADVMTITILEKDDCEKLGMGAFLGVSAASMLPPKFIHLKYSPPSGIVKTRLAIVGKALTFDSGGYNIKAGAGSMIELMKFDMGGAGAALGAAEAIGAIKPEGVEVHFIAAACENMISGTGMRPGDILTASNGKTIEVNNTDAEGRLTLADALVYASKLEVDAIVDLATLTGACIVALGKDIAGMFTPNDAIADELLQAAKLAGEKFWRMPMEEGYMDMMKSSVADMVNTGGRAGGSITASLFLKEFVPEGLPWAHLDIAGPVWSDKKQGGTGFAVTTLVEWVMAAKPKQV